MERLLKALGGKHFTVVELGEAPSELGKAVICEMACEEGLVVQFAEDGREVHIAGPN